ncbi:MAG: hypothetical protein B7X90_04315 [Novosphingobium sp. 17-62-19]|uniref:hypothetical protein n=1 Tax=Novosphingobium sp. 17-62-19 TaxID=1970406 RepID=UPI000BCDC575|nr:hypothetical protein [Novosphingobium sp. 17-62-19]OZA20900.1 MAG: hypothetical protein B7X90_04315 [Novosphingobium sp. 17-62-19]HQS97224.1 hypothetical protein [Novosphingobium sp.]
MIRNRFLWLGSAAALAAVSGTLFAQESLLPPGFDTPPQQSRPAPQRTNAPARSPATAPRTTPTAPSTAQSAASQSTASSAPSVATTATPVIQPLPSGGGAPSGSGGGLSDEALLNSIDPALLAKVIESARPKSDIPPAGQRSLARVGVIDQSDGGFPALSTHYLNGAFVEGVIGKMRGRFVSRWGHILARRVLASRLATPVGMNGADWAAMRAQLLLRMGEAEAARGMVQSVDSGNFTRGLEDAALVSFMATADPVGLCPITALTASARPGNEWDMIRAICSAFANESSNAMSQLDRAMRQGKGSKIDILLAQKFAGAATNVRRAVKIEWEDVEALTPWSIGLSFATGIEPPQALRDKAGANYALLAARAPMLPLKSRAGAADVAAARGLLSARAMVDLYSELYAEREGGNDQPDEWSGRAETLRKAYVAAEQSERLEAIRTLWGDGSDPDRAFSGLVLTSYAAARVLPGEDVADSAAPLIASMLTAGLDRNALKWAPFCPVGSEAWGLLVLANPGRSNQVNSEGLNAFASDDESGGALRSQFLVAGLMGLERVDQAAARDFAGKFDLDLGRKTRWTSAIESAAASNNQALVALLAAFGMQGERWDRMTPLHLYHIVSALHRVGLDGEARMIAAEAVSRV